MISSEFESGAFLGQRFPVSPSRFVGLEIGHLGFCNDGSMGS